MSATFLYDGDCAFCTTAVRWLQRWAPVHAEFDVEVVPWQFADLDALGVPQARAEREVVWVDTDGAGDGPVGGAAGFARYLRTARGGWPLLGRLLQIRPISWVAAGVYRLIAVNRHRLPGGTPACALRPGPPEPCDE